MARSTMAEIIAQVRKLTRDPIGAATQFDDDDIQDALDNNRIDITTMELTPAPNIAPGGQVQYLRYYSDIGGAFEADYVLQWWNWAVITADSAELMIGVFHFNVHRLAPVFITGKLYDVYAAAADMLDMSLVSLKDAFDFSADGLSVNKSRAERVIPAIVERYRAQSRPVSAYLNRRDAN
jgi:hypothetical protein